MSDLPETEPGAGRKHKHYRNIVGDVGKDQDSRTDCITLMSVEGDVGIDRESALGHIEPFSLRKNVKSQLDSIRLRHRMKRSDRDLVVITDTMAEEPACVAARSQSQEGLIKPQPLGYCLDSLSLSDDKSVSSFGSSSKSERSMGDSHRNRSSRKAIKLGVKMSEPGVPLGDYVKTPSSHTASNVDQAIVLLQSVGSTGSVRQDRQKKKVVEPTVIPSVEVGAVVKAPTKTEKPAFQLATGAVKPHRTEFCWPVRTARSHSVYIKPTDVPSHLRVACETARRSAVKPPRGPALVAEYSWSVVLALGLLMVKSEFRLWTILFGMILASSVCRMLKAKPIIVDWFKLTVRSSALYEEQDKDLRAMTHRNNDIMATPVVSEWSCDIECYADLLSADASRDQVLPSDLLKVGDLIAGPSYNLSQTVYDMIVDGLIAADLTTTAIRTRLCGAHNITAINVDPSDMLIWGTKFHACLSVVDARCAGGLSGIVPSIREILDGPPAQRV